MSLKWSRATMLGQGKPADVITVFEYLEVIGEADPVGGLQYLNALAQYVPSSANIVRYAEIVKERRQRRELIAATDTIASSAFNTQGRPLDKILDQAQMEIARLTTAKGEREP